MRKASVILMALGVLFLISSAVVMAQEEEKEMGPQYIGAAKCKVCHNAEKRGAQYAKWQASAHAKAYDALASEEAVAIGKKMSIENPQTSDQCLKCHVTAFGVKAEMKAESFDMTEGVGCEACHGPGSEYKSLKIMKDKEAAVAAGLIIPTEETCVGCHNEESPTYKEFVFADFWKKIAHPIPKEEAKE
jgi:Zn finger protein HypA/HybF involved in hydrogenase expression